MVPAGVYNPLASCLPTQQKGSVRQQSFGQRYQEPTLYNTLLKATSELTPGSLLASTAIYPDPQTRRWTIYTELDMEEVPPKDRHLGFYLALVLVDLKNELLASQQPDVQALDMIIGKLGKRNLIHEPIQTAWQELGAFLKSPQSGVPPAGK